MSVKASERRQKGGSEREQKAGGRRRGIEDVKGGKWTLKRERGY